MHLESETDGEEKGTVSLRLRSAAYAVSCPASTALRDGHSPPRRIYLCPRYNLHRSNTNISETNFVFYYRYRSLTS